MLKLGASVSPGPSCCRRRLLQDWCRGRSGVVELAPVSDATWTLAEKLLVSPAILAACLGVQAALAIRWPVVLVGDHSLRWMLMAWLC